mgnify:CR=1 FL=1
MKKKIALILCASLALTAFGACSNDSSKKSNKNKKDKKDDKEITEVIDDVVANEDMNIIGDSINENPIIETQPAKEDPVFLYADYLSKYNIGDDYNGQLESAVPDTFAFLALTKDKHLVKVGTSVEDLGVFEDADSIIYHKNDIVLFQMKDGTICAHDAGLYASKDTLELIPIDIDDELIPLKPELGYLAAYTRSGDEFILKRYNMKTGEVETKGKIIFCYPENDDLIEVHGEPIDFQVYDDLEYVMFADGKVVKTYGGYSYSSDSGTITCSERVQDFITKDNLYGCINYGPVCIDDQLHYYEGIYSPMDFSEDLVECDLPEGFDPSEIVKFYTGYNASFILFEMSDGSIWCISGDDGLYKDETLSLPELQGHIVAVQHNKILMDDGNVYKYSFPY